MEYQFPLTNYFLESEVVNKITWFIGTRVLRLCTLPLFY